MPERAVLLGVGGRVAGNVLRPQFVFNLLESSLQLFSIVTDIDQPPARLLRHLLPCGVTVISKVPVKARVGDQDHVDDRIRFLRGSDQYEDLYLLP